MWIALNLATDDQLREVQKHIEAASHVFAEKAGLRQRPKKRRTDREPQLFERWCEQLRADQPAHPIERDINIDSVVHLEGHAALNRILPLVDRHEPRLVDSTDALACTRAGDLVVVQGKCTGSLVPDDCPWTWHLQVQGQIAVADAAFGLVVCGEGWARPEPPPRWPLRVWKIDRDDEKIAQIRRVIRRGWAEIEFLRDGAVRRMQS